MKRFLLIFLLLPTLGFSQVSSFMGRYDISKVDSVNDSTWKLTGTFVDVTGSWTALDADTGDKIIQRGYNSSGKVVFDRYVVTGISSSTAVNLVVFAKSDFATGVQNMTGMPFTGSFPIATPTSDTSTLTYRASFYQNSIDPDYDAALDNLNIREVNSTNNDYDDTLTSHNERINDIYPWVINQDSLAKQGLRTEYINHDSLDRQYARTRDLLKVSKADSNVNGSYVSKKYVDAVRQAIADSAAGKIYGTGVNGFIPHFLNSKKIDSSALYYDALNKRLGVGTMTPTNKLDVRGGLSAYTNQDSIKLYVDKNGPDMDGDSGLVIFPNGDAGLGTWGYGGTTGTAATEARLEIKGKPSNSSYLLLSTMSGGYKSGVKMRQNSLWGWDMYYDDATNKKGLFFDFVDNNANSTKIVIKNDGKVGIGTTSPGSTLGIAGNASIGANYAAQAAPSNGLIVEGNVGIGTVSPGGKIAISQAQSGYATAFTTPHIKLMASSTTDATGFTGISYATSTGDNYGWTNGALRASAGLGDFVWKYHAGSSAGTEIMRLSKDGYVGIGTASPYAKLDVRTTAFTPTGADAAIIVEDRTASSLGLQFYLNNAGTYASSRPAGGIGTANSSTLRIAGGGLITGDFSPSVGNFTPSFTDAGVISIKGDIKFYTKGGLTAGVQMDMAKYQRMQIGMDGKVGIGTTAPSSQLHVVGSIRTSDSLLTLGKIKAPYVTQSGAWDSLYVRETATGLLKTTVKPPAMYSAQDSTKNPWYYSSGYTIQRSSRNVGIKTNTPDSALTVSGGIKGGNLLLTGKATINGTIKIAGGSPGAGKVLVSDADGLASWADNSGAVYKGELDGDNGTPIAGGSALIDGTGTIGWYYACADSGHYDYGNPSGNILYLAVGDQAYYNGTVWLRIPGAGSYTLPAATASTLGGIKVGTSLQINSDVLNINDKDMGDITTSGTGSTWTIDNVNSNVGTYNTITINAKGQATAGSNTDYLDPSDTTGLANRTWVIAQDSLVKSGLRTEYINHDSLVKSGLRVEYVNHDSLDRQYARDKFSVIGHNHSGTYDNYGHWNFSVNGNSTPIASGSTVDLCSGYGITVYEDQYVYKPTVMLDTTKAATQYDLTPGNTAYGWGNHAGLYPLLADSNKTSAGNYITRKYLSDNYVSFPGFGTSHSTAAYGDHNHIIGNVDALQDSLNDSWNKRDTGTVLLSRARATSTYEPKIASGTTGQYWRGDKTWQPLPTSYNITAITGLQDSLNDRYRRKDTADVLLSRERAGHDYSVIGHNHSGTYDNYGHWNFSVNGNSTPIASGSTVDLCSGYGITVYEDQYVYKPTVMLDTTKAATQYDLIPGNTAYGWGNHASEGYLKSEVDGSITNEGDLSFADSSGLILIKSNTSKNRVRLYSGANMSLGIVGSTNNDKYIDISCTITDNSSNWNTAYGWGNHAGLYPSLADSNKTSAGNYITRKYLSDNFVSFPGFGTSHATAAYGDHGHSGYLTGESDPIFLASVPITAYLTQQNTFQYNQTIQNVDGKNTYLYLSDPSDDDSVSISFTSNYNNWELGVNTGGTFKIQTTVEKPLTLYIPNLSGGKLLSLDSDRGIQTTYSVSDTIQDEGSTSNLITTHGVWDKLCSYVPYTGANTDVNLGTHNLTAKEVSVTDSVTGPNFMITKEGGYAVKMIAGCDLEQGDVVRMGLANGTVTKTTILNDDSSYFVNNAVGVVYSTASTSESVWVVTSGRALVKFTSTYECEDAGVTCSWAKLGYLAAIGYQTCYDGETIQVIGESGRAVSVRTGFGAQTIGIITETKDFGESAYVILSINN